MLVSLVSASILSDAAVLQELEDAAMLLLPPLDTSEIFGQQRSPQPQWFLTVCFISENTTGGMVARAGHGELAPCSIPPKATAVMPEGYMPYGAPVEVGGLSIPHPSR